MGKMMLIVVISFGVIFSIISFNMMQANTRMTYNAVNEYSRMQAKGLAESGIDYSIMKIAQDTSWCTATRLSASGGTIDMTVVNTRSHFPDGPDVGEKGKVITSVGRFSGQTVTIRAVVQIPVIPEVPPWMRSALMSDQDLVLSGAVTVEDDGNPLWNADVHTNDDLFVNGIVRVEGFGSYYDNMVLHPNLASRFFIPNVNPASAPVAQQRPQVAIPVFNPAAYIAAATQVFRGATTIVNASNLVLGTYEHPEIIYIEGDLKLSGSFSGYGVYIVMGDIYVTGNVTTTSIDPLGNKLGFYSADDIFFAGNTSATGQMFAMDDVTFLGNNVLTGMVTAKGAMNFNGTVNVRYRPASANLTTPFWPGDIKRPQIVSYYQ